jgi:hypothetical protein
MGASGDHPANLIAGHLCGAADRDAPNQMIDTGCGR